MIAHVHPLFKFTRYCQQVTSITLQLPRTRPHNSEYLTQRGTEKGRGPAKQVTSPCAKQLVCQTDS
jgi:hypothetical protein